jgi:phage baseplate assembly protein W
MSIEGLAPKVPLVYDSQHGPYQMIQDYPSLVQQNLKMLLLTSPGERIMVPEYGVGLRRMLFEPATKYTHDVVREKIYQQVQTYMPFLNIKVLDINSGDGVNVDESLLSILLRYEIIPLKTNDFLSLNADLNRRVFI